MTDSAYIIVIVPGSEGPAGDPPVLPDAFFFTDVTEAALSTTYISNTITISGLALPDGTETSAVVSIVDGEFSINGGSFGGSPGTVVNGDTLAVRVSTGALQGVAIDAVLSVGDYDDTYSVTTLDTRPDAFAFTDVAVAALSTVYTSNTITLAGIESPPAAISIVGGTYSKNGGGYTSVAGTVTNGDTIAVRVTSSSSEATAVSATLTVGGGVDGISDTYSVTTLDITPSAFTFTDVTGATLLSSYTSNTITVAGINSASPISIAGSGTYSKNGAGYTASSGTVVNGDTVSVRVTSGGSALFAVTTTLTIGGVSDTYSVTTLAEPSDDHLADSGTMFPFYSESHQSCMYFSDTDTTWFAWQTNMDAGYYPVVRTFNHTTGVWSPKYVVAFDHPLADDDHGNPGIGRDANGRAYIFYGSHGSDQYWAVSTNANDPSLWTTKTPIAGGAGGFTYPSCDLVGSDLYLFVRGDGVSADAFSVLKATAPSGTGASFSAATVLLDFGTGRCYQGPHITRGTKIGIPFTQAAVDNSFRQDVFFLWYDTATGDVSNLAETTTVDVLDLPLDATDLETNFRLVNQASGGHYGSPPAICGGINGIDIHFCYLDSATLSGQYSVKYRKWNGTTLAAAEDVGNLPAAGLYHKYDRFIPIALANGDVDVYYITAGINTYDWGGDISKRTRSAAGSWGSVTLVQAAGATRPLNAVGNVKGPGHANARVVWAECVASVAWLAAVESGIQKIYAYGDGGYLKPPIPIYDQGWVPTSLGADLIAWWDSTAGDRIAYPPRDGITGSMRWANKVTPVNAWTQATANRQPTFSATGWDGTLPAFSGDGASSNGDYMLSNEGPFATVQSIFVVAERPASAADSLAHVIYRSAVSDGGAIAQLDTVGTGLDAAQTLARMTGQGTGAVVAQTTPFAVSTKAILFAQLKDNDLRVAINGGTVSSAGDIGNTTATAASIFGSSSGASNFGGKITGIVVVNRVVTGDEQQKMEGYLAWKWGIQASLAAGHPYKTVRPT